jgi:hypothetical protein
VNTSGGAGGYGSIAALLAAPAFTAMVVQQGTVPLMPVMGNAVGAAASWSGGSMMESCCASPVVREARGHLACWPAKVRASCAFPAMWSPCSRKPQQPSFRLLQDLHQHILQIVNDIETDRFIYIDTSMATLKLKKKYHCGPLTNKLKRMRQWQLETTRRRLDLIKLI